jgi:hypothetical protein
MSEPPTSERPMSERPMSERPMSDRHGRDAGTWAYKSLPGAAYRYEVGDTRVEPVRVASSQLRKG